MSTYFAHTKENGEKQALHDHLCGTADLCKKFAEQFDAGDQGYLTGLIHDIGKYSSEFQDRLLNQGPKVDHSTAGAFECIKLRQPFAAFCVAGHHSGLPNGGSKTDSADLGTFFGRINRARNNEIPDYDHWIEEVSIGSANLPTNLQGEQIGADFFIRMLYSCLTDADYLDTEHFMSHDNITRDSGDSLRHLATMLDAFIRNWFPPRSELNKQRCAILKQCISIGNESKPEFNLFSLTVPTGGGKTIASLAFALHHAVAFGKQRIIYIIPYTSIIEQTADVFRSIFGEENVLEHHSGILFDSFEETPEKNPMMLATENWDKPIVITTAVQFFESIYSNRSSKCRKLHNLANSVIIFDEVQMLPLQNLRPCVSAITQLVSNFKASAVLCTATQPALNSLINEYIPGLKVTEICPQNIYSPEIFKRVTFSVTGVMSWEQIEARMSENIQSLCIVNTRKSAGHLFSLLRNPDNAFHLSTMMVPAHRRKQLREIRDRLKNDLPCHVVSTSLIEAGVDVDFPLVLREVAGLDSMLQAAGRCNREGKRNAGDSNVILFSSESPVPPLFARNVDIGKMVLNHFQDISSDEAIAFYFRELLLLSGREAQDKYNIIPRISAGNFSFATIAEDFHMIDNDTITVYIPWENGEELIREMKRGNYSRNLFRKASQYAVSLYRQHFDELYRSGSICAIDNRQNLWYLSDKEKYSDRVGIIVEGNDQKVLFV